MRRRIGPEEPSRSAPLRTPVIDGLSLGDRDRLLALRKCVRCQQTAKPGSVLCRPCQRLAEGRPA